MMRRLTSLFHRPAEPVRRPVEPPRQGIVETICAPPKPQRRRCLNESGHKLSR
jgi:hypothetical protein